MATHQAIGKSNLLVRSGGDHYVVTIDLKEFKFLDLQDAQAGRPVDATKNTGNAALINNMRRVMNLESTLQKLHPDK